MMFSVQLEVVDENFKLTNFPCWAEGTKCCHLVWNANLAQHSGSCQMSNVLQRDSPTLQYVGSMKSGLKKWVAGYKSWQHFEQLSTAVMGKENKYFLIFLKNWINSYFCFFLVYLSLTSSIQTTVVYITHSRSWLPCWFGVEFIFMDWKKFLFIYFLCFQHLHTWVRNSSQPRFMNISFSQRIPIFWWFGQTTCSLRSEKRNTLKPLCMLFFF